MGCIEIMVSGGDPLLRQDFCELYKYIIKKGIKVSLEITGAFMTKRILETLIKYPPTMVFVTIFGFTDQVYRKTTNSNVSIKKVLNNVKLLHKYNIRLKLRTTITKDNYKEVYLIKEFAKKLQVQYTPGVRIW